MKFAKELEEGLVPEWRAKYFDYKTGKKKLKAVARALRGVTGTPGALQPRSALLTERSLMGDGVNSSPYQTIPAHSFLNRPRVRPRRSSFDRRTSRDGVSFDVSRETELEERSRRGSRPGHRSVASYRTERPLSEIDEAAEQRELGPARERPMTYGSFTSAPPSYIDPELPPPALVLPGPALDPGDGSSAQRPSPLTSERTMVPGMSRITSGVGVGVGVGGGGGASEATSEIGNMHPTPSTTAASGPTGRGLFQGRRRRGVSTLESSPFTFPRGTSSIGPSTRERTGFTARGPNDPLDAFREFDQRQTQFFVWMDDELKKIEDFYKDMEQKATDRLRVLRDQLYEMNERRAREALMARRAHQKSRAHARGGSDVRRRGHNGQKRAGAEGLSWRKVIGDVLARFRGDARLESRKMSFADDLPWLPAERSTSHPPEWHVRTDNRRDFERRKPSDAIPHRQAKRKLKAALSEYYRGLELLKSYALLNRTAFRKMNKKFDKLVQAYPGGRYVAEKVNTAWFVQSAVLDNNMRVVEDLYAKYIEHGNHKVAVGKLRTRVGRHVEYHGSTYRNGLLVGGGVVFGVQGLVAGARLLVQGDTETRTHTEYLLQLYGGYFLSLLLFLLFCLACRLWTEAKINYVFVFEFDTRHHLDWRQLSELPCLFLFLEGLFVWLNFTRVGPKALFEYYPIILIGLTVVILLFPARIFYGRSRLWWWTSNWRLLGSGLFPVEFRDFFLGDMYCSQTYTMGNIALFFCLYRRGWDEPTGCNSSHSWAVGALTAVPAIWRACQCLRRYRDTRNVFPHLLNGLKYLLTILYYLCLSGYRIDTSTRWRATFITVATVNAIYSSVWDVGMDWSLGNPNARPMFLRHVLGYKQTWMYYFAMVLDPILRFNWVFYAIFSRDIQHSALPSFLVSLSEVLRRGMWTLFRVENEHCTNVGRFRASRDVPLPYELPSPPGHTAEAPTTTGNKYATNQARPLSTRRPSYQPLTPGAATMATATTAQDTPMMGSGADLERATTHESARSGRLQLRQRRRSEARVSPPQESPLMRGLQRVGNVMANAHAQDFERRNKVVVGGEEVDDRDGLVLGLAGEELIDPDSTDDDDDDDEDDQEEGDGEGDEGIEEQPDHFATPPEQESQDPLVLPPDGTQTQPATPYSPFLILQGTS